MTVDECIDRVIDLTLQGLKPLAPDYSFQDAVADRDRFAVVLQALLDTETGRCEKIARGQGCDRVADEILATSPVREVGDEIQAK